jgi:hypothetical protein
VRTLARLGFLARCQTGRASSPSMTDGRVSATSSTVGALASRPSTLTKIRSAPSRPRRTPPTPSQQLQRGRAAEKHAARTGTTGPHHESRATGFRHTDRDGLARFDRKCRDAIASPPTGTTALRDGQPTGNKPEGTGCTHGRTDADSRTRAVWIGARTRRSHVVCAVPPPVRRTKHRTNRLTLVRPQTGRLADMVCLPMA